jgi:Zn-finger protein
LLVYIVQFVGVQCTVCWCTLYSLVYFVQFVGVHCIICWCTLYNLLVYIVTILRSVN